VGRAACSARGASRVRAHGASRAARFRGTVLLVEMAYHAAGETLARAPSSSFRPRASTRALAGPCDRRRSHGRRRGVFSHAAGIMGGAPRSALGRGERGRFAGDLSP
jgi:hypothetical protein